MVERTIQEVLLTERQVTITPDLLMIDKECLDNWSDTPRDPLLLSFEASLKAT